MLNVCTFNCSLDDEAFLHATNVANDDYVSHEYVSEEYETQYDDGNLDKDDKGFVAKGRSGKYTNAEDVLICTAWKKVSQDAVAETSPRLPGRWPGSLGLAPLFTIADFTLFCTVPSYWRGACPGHVLILAPPLSRYIHWKRPNGKHLLATHQGLLR